MTSKRRLGRAAVSLGFVVSVVGAEHVACEGHPRRFVALDPCAGVECGAPCTYCIPDAASCPEVLHACDARGQCVPAPVVCNYAPCAGKVCGEPCSICPEGDPECIETAVLKQCTMGGQCVAAPAQCGPPADAGADARAGDAHAPAG